MAAKPLSAEAKAAGASKSVIDAIKATGLGHGEAVDAINAHVANGYDHERDGPVTAEMVLGHAPASDGLNPSDYAVEGGATPVGGGDDPFDLDNIAVSGTSAEDLGIEKPILHIPVDKPGRQDFFRVHPDPAYRLDARIIKLEAERESYLVTRAVWPAIPGETKLVKLVPCLTRLGTLYLWPLPMPDDLMGKRDTAWGTTARKAAEMAETKWVRMQANMAAGSYDVVTSDKIADPVWPKAEFKEMLKIAFGDGRLIDRMDHPVVRQLEGK